MATEDTRREIAVRVVGGSMSLEEKIIRQVHELPESKKTEVLDFVEYLKAKTEEKEWSGFSLASAMRGMEDEDSLYSLRDIREVFS
jgi:hypothetical protein